MLFRRCIWSVHSAPNSEDKIIIKLTYFSCQYQKNVYNYIISCHSLLQLNFFEEKESTGKFSSIRKKKSKVRVTDSLFVRSIDPMHRCINWLRQNYFTTSSRFKSICTKSDIVTINRRNHKKVLKQIYQMVAPVRKKIYFLIDFSR